MRRVRAHPRSRGENDGGFAWRAGFPGSSPLTRGKRCQRPHRAEVLRLIPAHAGKTRTPWSAHQSRGAHPRSRGENKLPPRNTPSNLGSSPLTRGKPIDSLGDLAISRLIPAHAGKTTCSWSPRMTPRAHPRSRGENGETSRPSRAAAGSSPLTRGKLPKPTTGQLTKGLIPAHAGKTAGSRTRANGWRAHPRSRGENVVCVFRKLVSRGSSPLTRGKPYSSHSRDVYPGLIPAHAGKTASRPLGTARRGAHPRSRGENRRSDRPPPSRGGSSPLTRGKPRMRHRATPDRGLIPAHAGKTDRPGRLGGNGRAHPRSRGENDARRSARCRVGGSSPLTRGKRDRLPDLRRKTGLIPAHAGKTMQAAMQLTRDKAVKSCGVV